MRQTRTTRFLGWFSIGLGLVELFAPHRLTRRLGMGGHEKLVAGYGAREVATGIGLLASRDPTPWLWGRVAGDALDLGTLAAAGHPRNRQQDALGLAVAAVIGITVVDLVTASRHRSNGRRHRRAPDYGHRSGLPKPANEMRGAAKDFGVPQDFRIPEPLRPWKAA